MFFFLRIPWEVGTPGCVGKEYWDNGIKVNSLYIVFTETYVYVCKCVYQIVVFVSVSVVRVPSNSARECRTATKIQ